MGTPAPSAPTPAAASGTDGSCPACSVHSAQTVLPAKAGGSHPCIPREGKRQLFQVLGGNSIDIYRN